jgi:hypothetical protein
MTGIRPVMLRSRSRPQEASADAGQVSERLDSRRKGTFAAYRYATLFKVAYAGGCALPWSPVWTSRISTEPACTGVWVLHVQLLASCAQLWRQDDGVSRFGLSKAGRFLVAVAVDNTAGDRFAGEADGPGLRPG